MITLEEIDAIGQRASLATAGPWQYLKENPHTNVGSSFIQTAGEDLEVLGATDADCYFIARARQDVPRLLEEIVRLKGLAGEL
jgi:hypothetical protein